MNTTRLSASKTMNTTRLSASKNENLLHAEKVTVFCSCGHRGTVSVEAIKARFPGHEPIDAIKRVMRCRVCNARGVLEVDGCVTLGYDEPW